MKILDIPRSGSYAGVTSGHNRAGQYVRNRRTPTNAPSARRTAIRSAMAAASSGYATLTAAQQAAWAASADGHPITDRLGSSIKLTGHQLHVAINTQLINVGQAAVLVPPADFATFSCAGVTPTYSLATGLAFSGTPSGTASDFVILSLTRPMSAGRSFAATFSQVSFGDGNVAPSSLTPSEYTSRFGTPVVGQKIFVKLTPVNQYGVTGSALVIPVVVTA